jgi:hypothetical protein
MELAWRGGPGGNRRFPPGQITRPSTVRNFIAGTGSQNVPQNPEQHPTLCGYTEFHVPWDGRVPGVGRKARLVVSQEYGENRSPAVFRVSRALGWRCPRNRADPRAFTAGGGGPGGAEPPRVLSRALGWRCPRNSPKGGLWGPRLASVLASAHFWDGPIPGVAYVWRFYWKGGPGGGP